MAAGEYAAMTPRQRYDAVCEAIFELATGRIKTFHLGSRSVTYHDLSELRALKNELADEVRASESADGCAPGVTVSYFDRR